MVFNPTDFTDWGEQDVREGILVQLLERLGYEKGTKNDIKRQEQLKLEYDKVIFGRPKKTDRPLQSFPDYILEVDKTWRWVIEAKPPSEVIGKKETWQAYSYAKHHEVQAVMYAICNGRELQIFRTDFIQEAALVRTFKFEEFEGEFESIEHILSPDVIRKTWPKIEIDTGKPLGKGLKSFAQITGGNFTYNHVRINYPRLSRIEPSILKDLLFTIVGGFIERTDDDKLRAVVVTRSPSIEAQRISEQIGIDKMELWSDSSQISSDPERPTILSYSASYTMPPSRTSMLGMPPYPHAIPCAVNTTIRAHLRDSTIKGEFEAKLVLGVMNTNVPMTISGELDAQVD